MSRSLNPEQKQAIEAEAKQILVSAAAGSGKTTVLIERIKRLITEKRAPLSSMLIVTFTNAAAAEMRQRIAGALTAQLEKADDAFLRAQLSDIYNAHISTFHAFALDVIRTYYFKIGLAPDLRICDEAQRTLLRNETAEELFAARFEEEDPRFADFLDRYSDEKNDDALKEDILFAAYDAARVMPDPFGWLREKTQMPGKTREEILGGGLEKEIRRDVAAALSKIRTLCEQARGMLERGDAPARARLCGEDIIGLRDIQENADAMPLESLLARLKSFDFRRLAGKAEQEAYIRVEDDVKRVRGKAKKLLKDKLLACYCMQPLDAYIADINATAGQAAYLYELILDFDARFSRKKTEKGLMDFADAEHYALRILDDEEAAAEYRARFRYIFIDEYQDCNLMQDSLIRRISGDADVFMVGDVKQSIYKFRLAEPELFTAKYEAFQRGETPGGLLIDLNQNYRSKAPVIDAVNAIFSRIMTPETADIRYDENAALKKGMCFDDEAHRSKEAAFYVIDDGAPEEESAAPETPEWTGTPDETQKVARDGGEAAQTIAEMKKTELEAAAAVTVVKETLYAPDGTKQRFFDTKTGEERDIGLRDVVLLLRGAKTQAEVFRQVFSEQGIDAYVEAGEGYFDTVEIETFMNLLRVIDNRRRDVPLISVMYAPIFDFSTEELMDVRLAFPKGAYHEAVFACAAADADAGADACTASPRLREKISAMLARLEGWRENAAFMPLDEFVWELMKESGYYTYAGALPGGGQRQANLRALADKALDFQSTHMKGLQGFITYAEHVKRRVDTAPAKLIGESEEVLRIMTIHKSKGLEFPVVIVAGLGKRFRSDSSRSVAIHKDIGLALRWTDPAEGLYRKTLLQSMIERKKAREDLAEEIRILYVACTRAMDRLILLGSIRGGTKNLGRPDMSIEGRSYMELLLPAVRDTKLRIEGLSKADLLRAAGRESSRDVYFSSLLAAEPEGCGPESGREIWRRLSFSYPYKDAASRKSKYAATEMADTSFASAADRLPPAAVPRFMEAETVLGAAEKGSILHKAMELLDFHAAAEQAGRTAYFSAFLRDLVERGLFTPAEAETVDTEKLRAFLRSDVGRRAAQAAELQKEAPFVLKKIQDGEEILVQGVIDCYFMESDGCVLLDYKSGHLYRAAGESREAAKARLAERYRPQLEIYGEALEKIKGIPVKAACLYLLGEGESLWMEPR